MTFLDAAAAPPARSRRQVLRAACIGCAAAVVAGCSRSARQPEEDEVGQAATPEPASREGSVRPLARLADIEMGGSASVTAADGQKLLVSRPGVDTAVAFSARCTHMGCTVEPDGSRFACPCHGSVYDGRTGQVLDGPAPRPLTPYPVKVVNGLVMPR